MRQLLDWLELLIDRGGPVMWPLLALSVLSLTLILERAWFWLRTHSPTNRERLARLGAALRRGDRSAAGRLASAATPYDALVTTLLREGASDSAAVQAVHLHRPAFERFMLTLSTIITAAPLLGILGTVIGIIESFNLLGTRSTLTDPRDISSGIAQALLTTAVGLVIALFTLFPYMIFRGKVERALTWLESLIAAAQEGEKRSPPDGAADIRTPSTLGARKPDRAERLAEPAKALSTVPGQP